VATTARNLRPRRRAAALIINPFFSSSLVATRRLVVARRLARKVPGAVSPTTLGWALGLTIASSAVSVLAVVLLPAVRFGDLTATHVPASRPHHETTIEKKLHDGIDAQLAKAEVRVDVRNDGTYAWKTVHRRGGSAPSGRPTPSV